jgi:hypothetical protein
VATAVHGAWRDPPSLWNAARTELAEITPLVLRGGAGPLVWRRTRNSELGDSPPALLLQQSYRFHSLRDVLQQQQLQLVVSRLRSAGFEPLLAKGWAVARLYPEPGLRPYGDLDLYLPHEQHTAALASLTSWDQPVRSVDLHRGFRDLEDRSTEEIFARSRRIDVGGVEIRLFGPEDHLRLLCLHLLRHGASRPIWLCDIGAAVESRPADFDWQYFFSGNSRRTEYVVSTLVLAHRLLGARIEDTPVGERLRELPAWAEKAVLRAWGTGFKRREPMRSYTGRAGGVLNELRCHWPNPIEATARTGAPFNRLPRLPFQIANGVIRALRFAWPRSGLEAQLSRG